MLFRMKTRSKNYSDEFIEMSYDYLEHQSISLNYQAI